MSSQQYRLSLGSSTSIGPFSNYDPKQKSSWLCFLCGGNSVVDEDVPNEQRKSKIMLSKVTKTIKQANLRSCNNQDLVLDQKLERNNSHRLSLKSILGLKMPKTMNQSNIINPIMKMQSQKIIKTNQPLVKSTMINSTINPQCNVYTTNTLSQNLGSQSKFIGQSGSQKFIEPVRNIYEFKPQYIRSSQNITTADSSLIRKSISNILINPVIQQNVRQKIVTPQFQTKNYVMNSQSDNQQLNRKPSIKKSQKFIPKSEKSIEIQQTIEKQNICNGLKRTDSIEKIKQPKLIAKKSNSSEKSKKGSKFFMNMRKVTSRSEGPQSVKLNESTATSFFGQAGNKIKIGIKKVESFDSEDQDQDKFSQVLSHGQRSFLMAEINEVSERSRISTSSRFKFWQDQQKNPQN